MPLDIRARLGIGGLVAASLLLISTTYWAKTRKYVLVDMPVSLSVGFINTEFEISQRALYSVLIWTDNGNSLTCYEHSVLQTRRLRSLAGGLVSGLGPDVAPPGQDVTFGPYLGSFEGTPGQYNLKIEVLSDASCLNGGHPRLVIEASPLDYHRRDEAYALACTVSFFGAFLGVVLIILGRSESRP